MRIMCKGTCGQIAHKGNQKDTCRKISKVGGTLRRGWTAGNKEGVQAAVDSIQVTKSGNQYTIKIMNPTEYASFVEFGHRTANHNGWVKGQFMMTISENEIKRMAPGLLEKRLEEFLGGTFNA